MKVLERGDTWRFVTCPTCRSKLEIENSDIIPIKMGSSDDPTELVGFAKCAVCRAEIRLLAPQYFLRERYDALAYLDHDL